MDTKGGKVAVKGWKDSVDLTPEEAVTWLEDYCAAFLYTHVDTEGTMTGFPMDVAAVLRATTGRQLDRCRRHQGAGRGRRARCDGRGCRGGDGGVLGSDGSIDFCGWHNPIKEQTECRE